MKINILQKIRKNKSAPKVQRALKTSNTIFMLRKLENKNTKKPQHSECWGYINKIYYLLNTFNSN